MEWTAPPVQLNIPQQRLLMEILDRRSDPLRSGPWPAEFVFGDQVLKGRLAWWRRQANTIDCDATQLEHSIRECLAGGTVNVHRCVLRKSGTAPFRPIIRDDPWAFAASPPGSNRRIEKIFFLKICS